MKRILTVILVALLVIGLCACKSKTDDDIVASTSDGDVAAQEDVQTDKENNDKQDFENEAQTTLPQADEEKQPDTNDYQLESIQPDDSNDATDETVDDEIIRGEIKIDVGFVSNDTVEDVVKNCLSADIFVGKILFEEQIIPDNLLYQQNKDNPDKKYSYFLLNEDIESEKFSLNAKLYMYTVKIEKTINPIFVKEGETIKVISDISELSEPYKVGNRYTMYGTLYEYNGETVLRLYTVFAARVDDDGTLYGIGSDKKAMNSVGTLENLVANKTVQTISKKDISIPVEYKQSYGIGKFESVTDSKYKAILDKIIADGKKAIIADSDFKMELKPSEAVK